MRPVRELTTEDDGFRIVPLPGTKFDTIRRNSVRPEPEGTTVLFAFRVTGYDQDCDGSLMARLENVDGEGEPTGWEVKSIGLYPDCGILVTLDEWNDMFRT